MRTVSKAATVNIYRDVLYKGWQLPEGGSNLTIFSGLAVRPPRMLSDNFHVLATDYDNYAIVYSCLSSKNYKAKKNENVIILTR